MCVLCGNMGDTVSADGYFVPCVRRGVCVFCVVIWEILFVCYDTKNELDTVFFVEHLLQKMFQNTFF